MFRRWLRSAPVEHDYTVRGWGHDYTFKPINGGLLGRMQGWGGGLEDGHYLILPNKGKTTRYLIERCGYYGDPPDMWWADVVFAPRQHEQPA